MVAIYDTLGAYGGSHTLMLRMCEWLRNQSIDTAIICTSAENIEIVESLKAIGVKIINAELKDIRQGKDIFSKLLEDDLKVICFSWHKYLDVERLKKKYQYKFDNILYCIHPQTFKKGIGFRNRFLREYSRKNYLKIFEKMNQNDAIISLDEVNISESEAYLQCDLKNKPKIVRLPMHCIELDNKEAIIERGFYSETILTAARAEFPYKGYLIGLVDDFVELKRNYPSVKLEIVAAGDDIHQLKEKIENVPEELRKDIVLHGWMAYGELKTLMQTCKLFVGMGTSVFDAALQYKPAIVVSFNTYENNSDHFVAEMPTHMDSEPKCSEKAIGRIRRVMEWSLAEYRTQAIESFDKVKQLYDIDVCMGDLLRCTTKDKRSILTKSECARHKLNHIINDIRFRNRSFAEYKNIVEDRTN